MKILQVTNAYPTKHFPLHGIFVKEQLESLDKIGCQFDLYVINGKERGKKAYLEALWHLRSKVDQFDIIHCHHFLAALIVLWLKPERSKVIVSFLSDGPKELILPNFGFNKIIATKLYNYIINRSYKRIFKKAIPPNLINDSGSFYLPNGVNMDLFKPIEPLEAKRKLNLDPQKKYILFASLNNRDRREKRYDIFSRTIEILRTQYGHTDVEELLLIKVDRNLVPYYFNAADVHLLTSDFEGSPNSVKESLSCNTPVVSTNVGNVAELISGLTECSISKTNDPKELAAGVHRVLVRGKAGLQLRKNIVRLELDMQSVAEKLAKIYLS